MELTITNYNTFFKVKGILNKKSVQQFQETFRNIFEELDSLTISIEGLESVDRHGVNALAKLHNESLTKNKSLSIIGYGCKDLFDYFKSEEAA